MDQCVAELNVMPLEIEAPSGVSADPAGWSGESLSGSTDWQYRLDSRDLAELAGALEFVKDSGMSTINLRSRSDFPLDRLARTLDSVSGDVHNGRGFVLIKGMPVDQYSREDIAIMYWGIGIYLGYPVSQNAKGHMLGHVTDLGHGSLRIERFGENEQVFNHTDIRGYNTRERFHFHTDGSDVVGLLCLHPAMQGGQSIIASSVALHNEILRRRPDLLSVLYQPFWVSRQNEVPTGATPYFQMPVFHEYQGRFLAYYTRAYIESCKVFSELPALTAEQYEAFALIDDVLADPRMQLSMNLEKGDIQFLNNHVVLHTRTAYEDFVEPERKRHLLRLWLASPEARPLPHWYYDEAGAGRRAGIYVPGMTEVASLEP